jgi:y4mF family transcriptional regulator
MNTTNHINSIAPFIKYKRKELKLTQYDLSQKAGVGIRFIRELESGKETLKMDKINQVLMLFGHKLGPVKIIRDLN